MSDYTLFSVGYVTTIKVTFAIYSDSKKDAQRSITRTGEVMAKEIKELKEEISRLEKERNSLRKENEKLETKAIELEELKGKYSEQSGQISALSKENEALKKQEGILQGEFPKLPVPDRFIKARDLLAEVISNKKSKTQLFSLNMKDGKRIALQIKMKDGVCEDASFMIM